MPRAPMTVLLLLGSLVTLTVGWIGSAEFRDSAAGPADPIHKSVTADLGESGLLHLTETVYLGPLCAVEGESGVLRRPLLFAGVFDYGGVLSDQHSGFRMPDAAGSEPVVTGGGAANPDEARDFARLLLGQAEEKTVGETLPRWRITIQPTEGLTWGAVATAADMSVTWEPVPPKSK